MSSPLEPLTVTVPRIATARLVLREFRHTDFDGFAANLADPEATRFLSGPSDRRTASRIFSAGAGGWILHGMGWWSVESQATGEVVGSVGVFVRETSPDVEIGWSIYPRFWGQGYATESAKAALQYAIDTHGARRVIAHIEKANVPSLSVSRKLGMKYEKDVPFFDITLGCYALTF
jgi:RimJ/RimL family protein N-acetyltransferase